MPTAPAMQPADRRQQDAETTESGRGRQERGRWRGDHGDARQRHDELAAATDALAPGLHAPAVLGDQALDERQADPEAGLRAILRDVELDEEVEDRLELLVRDARSRVAHAHDRLIVALFDCHVDAAALL